MYHNHLDSSLIGTFGHLVRHYIMFHCTINLIFIINKRTHKVTRIILLTHSKYATKYYDPFFEKKRRIVQRPPVTKTDHLEVIESRWMESTN